MDKPEFRAPRKISDLAEFADEYIAFMRAVPHNSVCDALIDHAHDYLRDVPSSQYQLCWLAIMFVDRIYRCSAELIVKDGSVTEYFSRVTRYVLDVLAYRGVRVLYILDNEIRFDRFDVASDLFFRAGVFVVSPYTTSDGPMPYGAVKREIELHLGAGRHVAYIEMDASVNYLEPVLDLGRDSNRLVIFRNEAPSNPNVQHIPSRAVPALTS